MNSFNLYEATDFSASDKSIAYITQISVKRVKKLMEQNNKCFNTMNEFVAQIEKLNYPAFLAAEEERLDLKQFKISQMNPQNASELYRDIFIKFMKNYSQKTELNWGENELRLFMWILVSYIHLKQIRIQDLGEKDWEYFCRFFPNKQAILFQYQAKSLMNDPTPTKKWTSEEDQLFGLLVKNKEGKYKWSELAKELYINSNRFYYRTPKQCRERWLNHLDPNKSKEQWELREDYILISHVHSKGKKWAEISKLLKNRRNEHSIKNRFKSLITKETKLHNQPKPEEVLIQIIFKKYDNHFSKLKPMNSLTSLPSGQQIKNEYSTSNTIKQNTILSKEAFELQKSVKHCKKEQIQPSSIEKFSSGFQLPIINSSLDLALKQERQKQIRADMFLSSDPFDLLKKFFKSKDSFFEYR